MKLAMLLSSLFLGIALAGCKSDNNPVGTTDQLLEKNIIGNWSRPLFTIKFNPDYTFSDSIINVIWKDSSHNFVDTTKRTGKYYINDGILYLIDFYYTYVSTSTEGAGSSSIEYEISIDANRLTMNPVIICNPVGSYTGTLNGSWIRESWFCGYVSTDSTKFYTGMRQEQYTFFSDSSKYIYHLKYVTGRFSPSEYTLSGRYTFQNTILNIPEMLVQNTRVEFKSDKMYWHLNEPVGVLTRIE